jgi:hypothetical protein
MIAAPLNRKVRLEHTKVLERTRALEADLEWLQRDVAETRRLLAEQEQALAEKTRELDTLGCEYWTEDGLPCRERGGRRGRAFEVVNGMVCCETHAQIRKYTVASVPAAQN